MSKSIPVKPQLESTHSASFCNKNHQNLFINKKVLKNTILSAQNLGITPLTLAGVAVSGFPLLVCVQHTVCGGVSFTDFTATARFRKCFHIPRYPRNTVLAALRQDAVVAKVHSYIRAHATVFLSKENSGFQRTGWATFFRCVEGCKPIKTMFYYH